MLFNAHYAQNYAGIIGASLLDNDDHIRLGKILSYDKYEENTPIQYSMTRNPLIHYSTGTTPVFNIQKSNVTIEAPFVQPLKSIII